MPQTMARTALSLRFAPMFWATKAERDCMNEEGTSMMNMQSFSATPTPAEGMTPSELTMAMMARKEMLTRASCRAIGKPSFSVLKITCR